VSGSAALPVPPGGSEQSSKVSSRRELTAAVLGAVLAGGLALVAGGQGWARVTVDRSPPLPPVTGVLNGADAAPLVPATGLVLLAAAVALLAVHGAGRVVVGLLMAVAGGVLAWSGLRVLTGGLDAAAADLPGVGGARSAAATVDLAAGWPLLAVVAGLLGVAGGLLVVLRGRSWPGMGRRYERHGSPAAPARAQTDEDRAQAAWRALDRGEDPTADPSGDQRGGPEVT
jgi:uncharacterized membrane protein (TIGR02234 family)